MVVDGRQTKEAKDQLACLFGEDNVYAAKVWIDQQQVDVESRREGTTKLEDLGMSRIAPAPTQSQASTLSRLFTSLLPQMLTAIGVAGALQFSGINAVFLYSSGIFKQAGLSDSRIGVMIVNSFNLVPTLLSGFLASRFGNRKLILFGLAGMLLSALGITASLVTHMSSLAILFVALYMITYGASLGPLVWGVMADMFPDDARAVGCSVCVGCSWSCSLIIGLTYPYIAAALENYNFVPFMYTIALSFLFFFSVVPDTYGKTIQDIQDEFAAKRMKILATTDHGQNQIPLLE